MKSLKLFVASIVLGFCAMAHAGNVVINTDGLSEADVAALKAKAAAVAAANASSAKSGNGAVDDTTKTLAAAATWGQQAAQAAEGFAKAIGIAARELNVEVNRFADTTVGKLVIAFIILKVVGFKLFYFIAISFGFAVLVWIFRSFSARVTRSSTYKEVVTPSRLNGLIAEKTSRVYDQLSWREMHENQAAMFVLSTLAQGVTGIIYLIAMSQILG